MDDNKKHTDNVFPLIYSLLCLCVTAGSVLLILYVFFPALSQPWQPVAALILIASPWFVWILTYIYGCLKSCCCGGDSSDCQIPIQQTTRSNYRSTISDQKGGGGQHNDGGQHHGGTFDASV